MSGGGGGKPVDENRDGKLETLLLHIITFFQAPLQIFLVIFFSYRDVVVIPSSLSKLKLNSVGEMAVVGGTKGIVRQTAFSNNEKWSGVWVDSLFAWENGQVFRGRIKERISATEKMNF